MPVAVDVQILGADKVTAGLDTLGAHTRNLKPFWEWYEPEVYVRFADWLESEGEGSWAPLSPRYAAWKRKVRPGRPLMVFDGDLQSSLFGPDRDGSVRRIDNESGEWGTSIDYAEFHQRGTVKMPQRELIVWDDEDTRNLQEKAAEYFQGRMDDAFR